MLYGPYSTYNTSMPHMRNRKYKFQFPYAFQDKTIVGNNNKLVYKRLQNSLTFIKPNQSYIYSSRDIAPYNAYFLTRFNAYINIKSYIGYCAIKYVFKYIYKGPNYATITLGAQAAGAKPQQPINKIKEYIDAQYIATYKALQRIYKNCIYSRSIPIQQLAIYLEGQQFITTQPN